MNWTIKINGGYRAVCRAEWKAGPGGCVCKGPVASTEKKALASAEKEGWQITLLGPICPGHVSTLPNPAPRWILPKAIIRQIVDRLHVGMPDEQVAAEIVKRTKGPIWTPARLKKAIQYAIKIHRENQERYRRVVGGRFNPAKKDRLLEEARELLRIAYADVRAGHKEAAEYWKGKAAGLAQAALSMNPHAGLSGLMSKAEAKKALRFS